MKTVYFFQSQFSYEHQGVKQYWFPYTAGSLWVYAKQQLDDWQLGDIQYKRDDIQDYVDSIDQIDLACFCTYIWNKEYNIQLAHAIRAKFPDCHISFGGPQTTEDYLDFCDSVCLTEGEVSLVELMTDISQGNPTKDIYENDRMPSLDGIPSPYTEGLFDQMILDEPNAKWAAVFESNRGCPYSCTFCEWGGLTASKIFQFSMERVTAELEWFRDNPVAVIFLSDANFGIFKERDLEIARLMRDTLSDSKLEYISLNYAKNSNERIFEIAKTLGTVSKGITISAQSMNPETLKVIKRTNMKVNNFTSMMKLADKYNTYTYTELILGLPLETKETWKKGICDLMELGQHNKIYIQKGTLLPNTEWNKSHKEQYNIETVKLWDFVPGAVVDEKDEEHMDFVVSTNTMDRDDMHESFMFSFMCEQMHYNGYSQIIAKYLRVKHNISYREFYDKMFEMIGSYKGVEAEFNRISKTYRDFQRTGRTTTPGIKAHTLEIVSRKVFYEMYKDCIDFALAVGEQFANIPETVIEMQKRFLNNQYYTVPFTATLDVNLETMTEDETEYRIVDLAEYISSNRTGADFPRGTIERNKILKQDEESRKKEKARAGGVNERNKIIYESIN